MIGFVTMVSIGRPIENVFAFAFVSEPTQFPRSASLPKECNRNRAAAGYR